MLNDMKKTLIHAILFVVLCMGFQSCLFDEKDNFSQSAADRQSEAVEKCAELLKSSPNGWKLEYYVGEDYALGGFPVFLNFKDKGVEMASACSVPSVESGKVVTSLYQVKAEQETMLTFDTYNPILHYFAKPSGGGSDPNANLQGDYEFVVRRMTEDSVYLEGKKYKNEMVLTRLDDTVKWSDYFRKVKAVQSETYWYYYNVSENGATKGQVQREGNCLYYQPTGMDTTYVCPFIYTDTGIQLHTPLTVDGKAARNFTWDKSAGKLVCSDSSAAGIELSGFLPKTAKSYDSFIGTYTLTGHTFRTNAQGYILGFDQPVTMRVSITANKRGENYSMSGADLMIPVPVNYDKGIGGLAIVSQGLGAYQFNTGTLYVGLQAGFGGNSVAYAEAVSSDIDKTQALGIVLNDNPLTVSFNEGGTFSGFFLWAYSNASYTQSAGVIDMLTEIKLVKQ